MRPSVLSRVSSLAAALVAAGLIFLPLWWVFASSLRPGNTFVEYLTPLSWTAFLPLGGSFTNYSVLLSGDFARALLNSFFVAGATVVLGLVIAVLAAYALAVLDFPGRGLVFAFVILVSMVPFDAIAIPLSGLFSTWRLSDTYAGLILPALANGFSIFVLRQFFLGVPRELLDAAEVDGLGRLGILIRIVLPLSKPALIGAALMLFLSQWQAYLWPLLIGTSPAKQLAPIALANLSSLYQVDLGQILAGSFVLSVVPMILLLFFQRQYTDSLSTTGLRG
ncbi:binding-protein-dependent transport systems inner membrane component [Kribbella flavida DSM 17836]|uniref:Binding-protein-dependent transport systems inner membrane component n=1 Tax=Kribbella flavida (strain DSM 17836 / JCM 10339 / NBRC 14399) TaxID=479435 RepID=D2PWT2_KRIFD|nr:carbohydrate ABC transporter permease [Kribbella flavida]ADB33551.1 binding-protein-dependent transport systems inner membrane component [Kribbella flavida DSM 17836]